MSTDENADESADDHAHEIAKVREALAAEVASIADECVRIAKELDVELDFGEPSIAMVERLVGELAASEMTDPQKDNAAHLFAAYLLEVARRTHGGHYQWWEDRDGPVLVVGLPDCRIGLFTLDKLRGRIGGDKADDLSFFYSGFAARARRRQAGDSATYM